jgi:hypothetical protein
MSHTSSSTVRRTLLTVIVGAVVVAAPVAAQPTGRTLDWGLTDCRGVIALVPSSPEVLEPHLPDGFAATFPAGVAALLPPDPRLEAVVGLEVLDCAEGVGLHGTVEGLDYASFFTFAEPPAHLRSPDRDFHFVKWDVLVPDAPRRDVLRRYGLAARDGEATFRTWLPGAGGTAFDVGWTFEGGEGYRFRGVAGAPVDFIGSFVEHSSAGNGLAAWTTQFEAAAATGGAGVVELAQGGFPARVLGRTVADAYFLVPAGLDFVDGLITLPAQPAGPAQRG